MVLILVNVSKVSDWKWMNKTALVWITPNFGHGFIYIKILLTNVIFMYIDENECMEGTHQCGQICNNTLGSYTCSCLPCYRLASDERTCVGQLFLLLSRNQIVAVWRHFINVDV